MRYLLSSIAVGWLLVGCKAEPLQYLQKLPAAAAVVAQKFGQAEIRFKSKPSIQVFGAMLFLPIVDHSGSNIVRATDPDASRRYDPLVDLCEELVAQQNSKIFAGLVTFGTSAYVRKVPSNNMTSVCDTLRSQRTANENLGWTNYLSALSSASSELNRFLSAHANDNERYKVVAAFITDGAPDVLGPDGFTVITQSSTAIRNEVVAMRNMVLGYSSIVDEFRLHTAYYDKQGNISASAKALLEKMAEDGNGTYTQFVSGERLDVNGFLPPKVTRQYRVNQAWPVGEGIWEMVSGKVAMRLDSDMDGLSDEKEKEINCDPNSKDTNNNGVTDAVEFQIYGDCFQPRFPASIYPAGQDSDRDGLTDREEELLSSRLQLPFDRLNPISSSSALPDLIAFRTSLYALGSGQGDPDLDGMESARELSLWLPPFMPNAGITFRGLVHKIDELRVNEDGSREFLWTIDRVPLLRQAGDDRMRILIPQFLDGSQTCVQSVAEKKVQNGRVVFTEEDFQ